MIRVVHLLLALWAGSVWTICGIVAPTLFAVLERSVAGSVVGRFFATIAWLGLAIGIAVAVLTRLAGWPAQRRHTGLIAIAALPPVVSELALGPLMQQARLAGEMGRFAVLHSASAVLFLIAGIGAGALVWKFSRAE
jgi:hypothetical protein